MKMKTLTFAFDVEIDLDTYIPEGTIVSVCDCHQKDDATYIMYEGVSYAYLNYSFVELR
jgi:hypothetical protein